MQKQFESKKNLDLKETLGQKIFESNKKGEVLIQADYRFLMVQMCASLKPQLLLLPPELLPPSLLLELSSPFKDDMFNMGGCLKTRFLQQKTKDPTPPRSSSTTSSYPPS